MQDLLSLTEKLIRFRTLADRPDEIRRCTGFITELLSRHQVPHEVWNIGEAPAILVPPSSARTPLLLISHLDVVDGPESLFIPRIRDGRLWGRGAVDDKYAVALSLSLLLENFSESSGKGIAAAPPPFGLLITSDEETGGERGTGAILPQISCDFAIVLDGGRPDEVVTRQKGILRVRVETCGKSAHGARPWLGKNALEGLMEDLMRIQNLFRHEDPLYWEKTLNIGRMEGGGAVNQVPDRAFALLDIRFTEKENPIEIFREMETQLRHSRLVQETLDPVFTSGHSPLLDRLVQTFPDIRFIPEHGASDAHFLSENGIPGIVWGADGEMSQHSDEERVRIDSIARLRQHLRTFIALFQNSKDFFP